MRRWMLAAGTAAALAAAAAPVPAQNTPKGYRLENYSWPEAEAILRSDSVVVIPLGAAAEEHGRHLMLRSDLTIAEYFARRVLNVANVAVAPTLSYHFYPAFTEYPGSTSLTLDTARDMTIEAVRSFARFGPRRFYVLNTGVSTRRPLQLAATALETDGILLRFTDFAARADAASRRFRQQPGGWHADEIETSLMLHIAPASVDMSKAARDYNPAAPPNAPLTRRKDTEGAYSESGVWGDATLATAEKGAILAEALEAAILDDIEKLRTASPPAPSSARPRPVPVRPGAQLPMMVQGDCSPGDLRNIVQIGGAYSLHWANGDAENFAALWSKEGDIFHPDGTIERGRDVIFTNRADLFGRKEYQLSRHPLTLTMVRCVSYDVAVADGRWNLAGVKDTNGNALPTFEGQATLVVKRAGDGWRIEAYRYTLKPSAQPMPVFLKRPGWPGK